ncbi:energy-coupled thiamine transporter ThiT [Eupransor demetentiae]|uniref:Thiamine transporter ThiT (ThiT) n=1 Tax=Eupransor demetentiae TaxID=3109584 RepID=A0ABM9N474_9LACO|nr:Thiamine transporter ThiT (ThiT) [Lactobacillaceae bacterium LMG 33000]
MQSKSNLLFITEVALFVALSVILKFFAISAWGQGGDISLQMVPTMIMALRYGYKGGLTTGLLFGLIQLLLGAYIVHPVQAVLDYPMAFMLVGYTAIVAGPFQKALSQRTFGKASLYLTLGGLFGGTLRFLAHFASAIIFFGSYAPKGENVWLYSFVYNVSYVLPSTVVSIVAVALIVRLYPNLVRVQ